MTRKDELLDTLRRSYDGEAWHGAALEEVLADVTAEEARWRPAQHVHSIWEITLHVAGWTAEVANRLEHGRAGEPAGGDWPDADLESGEEGWQDAIQGVFNARDLVLAAVRKLDDAGLDLTRGTTLDPAGGFTRTGLIEGLVQHNAYHAGQISLLKKLMRAVV